MIRTFLDNLSDRERWLVLAAASLLVITILIFGIVNPILAFNADAKRDYQDIRRIAALTERASEAKAQPTTTGPLRSTVTSRARAAGISIARIADQDDQIDLTFSDVQYSSFYGWLIDLVEEDGLMVVDAIIRPGTSAETLEVRISLAKAG
ncbi:MAG: type II secretion system protein GspM [Pseudomonadota bacterium]